MPDFYHQVNEEKSYRRAFFLFASIALAGLCSIYPMACFKNHSSKERAKLDRKVENLDNRMREEADEIMDRLPHIRHRSHSPPRISHLPDSHRRRRHSTSTRRSSHYDDRRRRVRRHDEENYELSPVSSGRHRREQSRYRNDQDLDRERMHRHSGHPPPRRYHHSS